MATTLWHVVIQKPRVAKREKSLYLRARRYLGGKSQEKRVSAGTTDPVRAEFLRATFEADLNQIAPSPLVEGDDTIISLVAARRQSLAKADGSPNTLANYRSTCRALAKTCLARIPVSKLTKGHVLQAELELVETRSASTAELYMRIAKAAWNWARELEVISGGFPSPSKTHRPKQRRTKKRPYTDEEVARLLLWMRKLPDKRWALAFQILTDTGARIGAVLGIRGADIERGGRTYINFRWQWIAKNGGGCGRVGSWRTLKTDEEGRIPLPEDTALLIPEDLDPDELLFPNRMGVTRPATASGFRAVIKRGVRALGIPDHKNLDTHSLRRAWVSTASREGVPDSLGMRVTGHAQVATYHRYRRNSREDLSGAVDTVADARRRAADEVRAKYATPVEVVLPHRSRGEKRGGARPGSPHRHSLLETGEPALHRGTEHHERKPSGGADDGILCVYVGLPTRKTVGQDSSIRTLSTWADESPEAMLRVLTDPALRRQLLAAMSSSGALDRLAGDQSA